MNIKDLNMEVRLRNSNKKTRCFTILHVSYIKAKKKKKKYQLTGGIIKRPLSNIVSKHFKMNLR